MSTETKQGLSVGKLVKWILLGWLGLCLLGGLILIVALLAYDPVGDKAVLRLELRGEISDARGPALEQLFGGEPKLVLRDITRALRAAADDERIVGLVLDVKDPELTLAQITEIAEAMDVYRKSGKWQRGFLETAGELSPANGAYVLAALADTVTIAPPGDINVAGLRAEVPFLRGALDKLHVEPSFDKRYGYKTAANMFTEKGFTKEHTESLHSLVDDLQATYVHLVAERRKVDDQKVLGWLTDGPFSAEKARELGLVDTVAYWDDIETEARKLAERDKDEDATLSLAAYSQHVPSKPSAGKIGLIVGEGMIVRGEAKPGFDGESAMGSDTIAQAFRNARADEVKGVLFRVNSPGGSYVASDLVRREVELTRAAGIPVVISMGSLAASGGYFVAMQADYIVATPATLTGSIGVFGGSMATRHFFEDFLGITFGVYDSIPASSNVSGLDGPDAGELEKRKQALDRIYEDFVQKAATGRKKTRDEIHAVAQGRVWTGKQGLERGLVDELGGFHVALKKLKELCKLDPEGAVDVYEYPEPEGLFASLGHLVLEPKLPVLGRLATSAELERLDKASRLMHEATRENGALMAMPFRIDIQ